MSRPPLQTDKTVVNHVQSVCKKSMQSCYIAPPARFAPLDGIEPHLGKLSSLVEAALYWPELLQGQMKRSSSSKFLWTHCIFSQSMMHWLFVFSCRFSRTVKNPAIIVQCLRHRSGVLQSGAEISNVSLLACKKLQLIDVNYELSEWYRIIVHAELAHANQNIAVSQPC